MFVANVCLHLCRYHFLQCGPVVHLFTLVCLPGLALFRLPRDGWHFSAFTGTGAIFLAASERVGIRLFSRVNSAFRVWWCRNTRADFWICLAVFLQ